MSEEKKSPALKEFEAQLTPSHAHKFGKIPRAAGQKREERIEQAQPSHGVSTHSDKDNSHAFKHAAHGNTGKKPKGAGGGHDYEG